MKRVIIIGGGFAGSQIAKKLEDKFEIILIDTKDYFEFTPGILRTIVEPEHIKKIQVLHDSYLKKTKIILGEVTEIENNYVIIKNKRGRALKSSIGNPIEGKTKFDYLVIASGSYYDPPIKERNIMTIIRAKSLKENYESLCEARSILIIGGGLVGVELCGEILDKYNNKKITIVQLPDRLITRNKKKSINYVEKFLKKRGVNLILNERIIGNKNNVFFTDKEKKINAEFAFFCIGIRPNFEFMRKNFSDKLTDNNYIKVNKYLQLKGKRNIFVAGDITDVQEEKTAQNAKLHAKIVVKNICAIEKNHKLKEYKPKARPMVISLGKLNGILEYKNIVLTGIIPAFIKRFVEWREMRFYKT